MDSRPSRSARTYPTSHRKARRAPTVRRRRRSRFACRLRDRVRGQQDRHQQDRSLRLLGLAQTDRRAELGELALLSRHRRQGPPSDARGVRGKDRHRRQLHRGDPGQRTLLREGPALAVRRSVLRLRPGGDLQRHLLQQVQGAGVLPAAGPVTPHELPQVRRSALPGRGVRPGQRAVHPLAGGSPGSATTPSRPGGRSPAGRTFRTRRSRARSA